MRHGRLRAGAAAVAVALAAVTPLPVLAAPYTPRADDEVVERLPLRAGSAEERARQRAAQLALGRRPHDLPQALAAAREAIERSRRFGDPRELGTAQAWLQPLWADPKAPPAARLFKAIVLQARHEFDAALAELDRLVAERDLPAPLRAQAELTRAGVLQVRGRWDDARAGCTRLAAPPLSSPHGLACLAELDSLQGQADSAQQRLQALDRMPSAPHAWLALLRAELAERQGTPEAGKLYARALQLDDDIYVRAAYADWLLDAGRPKDAAALVLPPPSAGADADAALDGLPDALLLRLAVATKRAGMPQAPRAASEMQARFDAAALRGDDIHARERARFALDVRGDAALALQQAELNWTQQREPADAVLLTRAARAASRPEAAEPVRRFARERGLQDHRLGAP